MTPGARMDGIRLVIFDLDGTLIDAYQAIYRSFNRTMGEAGYPARPERVIRRAVGWGDRNLLKPFVREADLDRVLEIYRKDHIKSLPRWSRLLPGVRRLLTALRKRGYRLAVASNRPTRFSLTLLRECGIKKDFDAVLCGDRVSRGKPDPEMIRRIMARLKMRPGQTLYVGDMFIDVQAARRAGVRSAAVLTGSSTRSELAREKPDLLLGKAADLQKVLPAAN